MRGYFPDNVSEYTKEQCEEYLMDHPNGLRADLVRERLKILTSPTPTDTVYDEEMYWEHSHNTIAGLESYKHKYPQGKHIEECISLLKNKEDGTNTGSTSSNSELSGSMSNTTNTDSSGTDGGEKIVKVLLCIGVIVLVLFATFKWHWIGTAIAAPLAYIACRNIWNEL